MGTSLVRSRAMAAPSHNEESIFSEALEKRSAEERAAFLDAACGADASLRGRIERLLQWHEESHGFLRKPLGATMDEQPLVERPGTVIGPYKLKELIGEG